MIVRLQGKTNESDGLQSGAFDGDDGDAGKSAIFESKQTFDNQL